MKYSIYCGLISSSRKENWDNGDTDPYSVIEGNTYEITCMNWMKFLSVAKACLKDQIQIDWGSFAWKGYKKDIDNLIAAMGSDILQSPKYLSSQHEYAVVFIEES